MGPEIQSAQKYNKWIVILSIAIPTVVALLFGVKLKNLGFDVKPLSFLPPIYAGINALTAIILFIAVWQVRKGNRLLHERLIKIAIGCSVAFLLMYVAYHMTAESASYGGEGVLKYVYYFILPTHIILSVVVIPFVLITYVRGITNDLERHRKIAKITYPLWLYVAVTGVIVYIMISPYYAG